MENITVLAASNVLKNPDPDDDDIPECMNFEHHEGDNDVEIETITKNLNAADNLIKAMTIALDQANGAMAVFRARIAELENENTTIKRGFDELLRINKVGTKQ